MLLRQACALMVLGLSLLAPDGVSARIYMCQDSMGRISYTNLPTMKGCIPLNLKGNSYSWPKKAEGGSKRFWRPGPKTFDSYIDEASVKYGVSVSLIKAMIHTESNFNPKAVSSMGARGLLQLMPGTAKDLGVVDSFNPEQNIMGGVRYFGKQMKTFDGDLRLSLAAYNAGPGLVRRIGKVPDIRETKNYIKKVLYHYKMYRAQSG